MVSKKEPCEGGGTSRQREQETQGANGVKEEALFQKPKGQHLQRERRQGQRRVRKVKAGGVQDGVGDRITELSRVYYGLKTWS